MATAGNFASVDRIKQNGALLGVLRPALQSLNVSDTRHRVPRYIDRMTAVPEVRGGSDALRGQVEVVGGAEDRVFRARLTGRTEVPHFLVGAYEEAAICVHSLARGWQTR